MSPHQEEQLQKSGHLPIFPEGSVFNKKKRSLDLPTKIILAAFIALTFLSLDSYYRSVQESNRKAVQTPPKFENHSR